ncbi:MAG TPA: MBL fold metallo-hydrolase [Woeseiaceae bacterium]|nr:MBL fold metallo-hydrolase [Woeseiaceae bacterium]
MPAKDLNGDIRYEFTTRPEAGETMPVAPGVLWLRMPLPFALGHINLWLLEDGGGWTIVDTGVHTEVTRNVWQEIFTGAMRDKPAVRVIATHLHPDHAGCAGWLASHLGVELWMSREEYLLCRVLVADTGKPVPEAGIRFYHAAGFPSDSMEHYQKMFGMFGRYVSALPDSYRRLQDGDRIQVGDREWEIIIGRGHSPEHACLYCAESKLMISGDQLLPTISSNVSVYPTEPAADPLAEWLQSLEKLKSRVPADVLVLPAHGKPFRGAHARIEALAAEHEAGLERLEGLCREPLRAVDAFPALFNSAIDKNNLIMATGESIAHLNYLVNQGRVVSHTGEDGVTWYRAP